LIDLTARIEPAHRRALRTIADAAVQVGIEWFLTGAMARDWVFTKIHGIDTLRATRDADIGIALTGWDEFERLRKVITDTGSFRAGRSPHRLDSNEIQGFHIDLVPFGQLGGAAAEIAWPPDQDIVMNVIGFEEAFGASLTVLADRDLPVRLASPAGQMLMKLFAWEDRKHLQPGKDAMDIRLLLLHYEKVAGQDLYAVAGLMEAEGFDANRAAARLLGRDVAIIVKPSTKDALARILDRELDDGSHQLLLEQLETGVGGRALHGEGLYEKHHALLSSFRSGLMERD